MKIADRVSEDTTTTGTGAYSLDGAQPGFRAFSSAFSTGDVVYYCCEDGTNWEVGIGTLTTGTPWTLARTTVLASSNAGAAVNWAAGTKNLFCTAPAQQVSGAAKAWVNFNGTGTPARRGWLNVSSITDVGVGEYRINFEQAMPDTNYAVLITSITDWTSVPIGFVEAQSWTGSGGASTTSVNVSTSNNSGAKVDRSYVGVGVFR